MIGCRLVLLLCIWMIGCRLVLRMHWMQALSFSCVYACLLVLLFMHSLSMFILLFMHSLCMFMHSFSMVRMHGHLFSRTHCVYADSVSSFDSLSLCRLSLSSFCASLSVECILCGYIHIELASLSLARSLAALSLSRLYSLSLVCRWVGGCLVRTACMHARAG